jgi:hypothetical protein
MVSNSLSSKLNSKSVMVIYRAPRHPRFRFHALVSALFKLMIRKQFSVGFRFLAKHGGLLIRGY